MSVVPPSLTHMPLTDQHRTILDLESRAEWWRYPGSKVGAIGRLDLTEPRYYQILNTLLDTPEALEYAPTTVRRLQRLRDERRRTRRVGFSA